MDNLNNISYADDWKNASDPVVCEKDDSQDDEKSGIEQKTKKAAGKPVLTLIQIILCVIIVLTAFVIKQFGGDLYKNVKDFYESEINNEIILNPYENDIDKLLDAFKN